MLLSSPHGSPAPSGPPRPPAPHQDAPGGSGQLRPPSAARSRTPSAARSRTPSAARSRSPSAGSAREARPLWHQPPPRAPEPQAPGRPSSTTDIGTSVTPAPRRLIHSWPSRRRPVPHHQQHRRQHRSAPRPLPRPAAHVQLARRLEISTHRLGLVPTHILTNPAPS